MQIIGQSRNIISSKQTAKMRMMTGTRKDRTEMTACMQEKIASNSVAKWEGQKTQVAHGKQKGMTIYY